MAGKVPMWLDCDPGHDDAAAILLAAHAPGCHLLGVSAVSGNVDVDKTTVNATRVLQLCGGRFARMKVLRGANQPLVVPEQHAPSIHGESGLEGSRLFDAFTRDVRPDLGQPLLETIREMARVIGSHPAKVDVVAVGALTNIALLFRLAPEVLRNVRQISIMGGAIGVGNFTPSAEFNIVCDPEAAEIVFNLPVKVVLAPLEVTHTVCVTDQIAARLEAELERSNLSTVVMDLMHFFRDTYVKVFGFDSPPLHDPVAVAYCLAPHLFKTQHMNVKVVPGGSLAEGQTICDQFNRTGRPKNVHVALAVDVAAFWDLMIDALQRCNKVSPINHFIAPKL